jgi:UDP-glucose 4-epimerase
MRILVTGGSGFIGNYLRPILKEHEVFSVDIESGVDIFDSLFEKLVKSHDVIIHLAALTNVEDSKINPKPYYMTNVLGTARVTYLCAKYGKKLIYPSTLHVFDPYSSPYADSKLQAEQIVKCVNKFIPVVILRLYNVFGKGMNNNSGSIINLFLTSKEVGVYGDGSVTRDFIHVKDVAAIMKDALKSKWDGACVEVGTGKGTSIKELAILFSYYRQVPLVYFKNKEQLRWPIANTKLLKKLYKEKLKTNIHKDIEELCRN